MSEMFIKILCMILGGLVGGLGFARLDKKYSIEVRINRKLNIKREWQSFFYTCIGLLIVFVVGILGINVIKMPNFVYFSLCGIILGISIYMSNKSVLTKPRRK